MPGSQPPHRQSAFLPPSNTKKEKKKSSKLSRATRRSQSAPASTHHATAGSIYITPLCLRASGKLTGNRIPATTRRDGTAGTFKHTRDPTIGRLFSPLSNRFQLGDTRSGQHESDLRVDEHPRPRSRHTVLGWVGLLCPRLCGRNDNTNSIRPVDRETVTSIEDGRRITRNPFLALAKTTAMPVLKEPREAAVAAASVRSVATHLGRTAARILLGREDTDCHPQPGVDFCEKPGMSSSSVTWIIVGAVL